MKSFNTVSKKQENNMLAEQQIVRDNDRARIVAAIKKEFGVNDFSKISEAERTSYKTMINEMWDRKTGITPAGVKFLNEAAIPLTKDSTPEQIEGYFKKKVKANAAKCVTALIAGKQCTLLSDLKSDVENKTGKKLSDTKCKKWVFDVCGRFLGESIKSSDISVMRINEDVSQVLYIIRQLSDGGKELRDKIKEYTQWLNMAKNECPQNVSDEISNILDAFVQYGNPILDLLNDDYFKYLDDRFNEASNLKSRF